MRQFSLGKSRLPAGFRDRMARLVWTLLAAAILGFAALSIWPTDGFFEPTPLPVQFEFSDGYFKQALPMGSLEVDERISTNPAIQAFRDWRPEDGGHVGDIQTNWFKLPPFIAIPFVGFPSEVPGNILQISCDSGTTTPIASARTGNQWSTVYLQAADLCPGLARIEAHVADPNFYIGLATPFAVSRFDYALHTSFAPRALVALATCLIFGSIGILAIVSIRSRYPLVLAFVFAGCISMVTLAIFMGAIPLPIARTIGAAIGLVPVGATVALWLFSDQVRRTISRALLAVIPWLLTRRRSSPIGELLLLGVAGIALTTLTNLSPAFVHHLPYSSILLLALAGAIAIGQLARPIALGVLAITSTYMAVVWILPLFWIADRVDWINLLSILAIGTLGVSLLSVRRASARASAPL